MKKNLIIFFILIISTFAKGQFTTDSIRLNHNHDLTYHQRKIDLSMAKHIMSSYPEPTLEINKAVNNRRAARACLIGSMSVFINGPLNDLINSNKVFWIEFAIIGAALGISIPFYTAKDHHLHKALNIYNSKISK